MPRRLLLLPLALLSCAHPTRLPTAATPGTPTLAVLTYNVNYGIPGDEATVRAIESSNAQLVFLQETTAAWKTASARRLQTRFPHQAWLESPGAGGQAVLSTRPFEVKDVLTAPTGWFPAIRVVAQSALGPVQILSVHLHPPVTESGGWVSGYFSTGHLRQSELASFATSLDTSLPTLVVGDFNEGPSGPAVQWLERQGLRTALPEYSPSAKTWRWDVGALRLTALLDHLAYDERLEPLEARVLEQGRSDHLPVRGVFVAARAGIVRPPPPSSGSLSIGLR